MQAHSQVERHGVLDVGFGDRTEFSRLGSGVTVTPDRRWGGRFGCLLDFLRGLVRGPRCWLLWFRGSFLLWQASVILGERLEELCGGPYNEVSRWAGKHFVNVPSKYFSWS